MLQELEYDNIETGLADGHEGWLEKGPFQVIMVTAAAVAIPPSLIAQLDEGGRMLIPVGTPLMVQELVLVEKLGGKIRSNTLMHVRFVPLIKDL